MNPVEQFTQEWGAVLTGLEVRASVPYNRDADFDETKRLKPGAEVLSPFIRQERDV